MVTRKKGALAQAKGEENTSPRRSPRKIQGVSRRAESAATEHQELVPPQDNPGQLLSCAVLTGRCNAEALMRAKRRNSTPQVHSCTATAFAHSAVLPLMRCAQNKPATAQQADCFCTHRMSNKSLLTIRSISRAASNISHSKWGA